MSYLDIGDFRFGYVVGPQVTRKGPFLPNLTGENAHLLPSRPQIVVRNMVTPFDTEKPRVFVQHDTGTGKTALSIRVMRKYLDINGLQVLVLGFENTKEVFINDAIRYPELGFVSQLEYNHLRELHSDYIRNKSVVAYNAYRDYSRFIRSKVTGKRGSSVQFYGYQEFANRVGFRDESVTTENVVINKQFVESLRGTLIIGDEIDNTYNTTSLNSRGMALKHVLDYHKNNVHFIALSATPLNNHPAESIELAQLLNDGPIVRQDYFDDEVLKNRDGFIALFAGKISTYRLRDFHLYPEKTFAKNATQLADIDPKAYRFVQCTMSKQHMEAYERGKAIENEDEDSNNSTYFLRDFAIESALTTGELNKKFGRNLPIDLGNLRIISAKYDQFAKDILEARGKTLIFHPRVVYGATLIEQIMELSGFIFEGAAPKPDTICVRCGKTAQFHGRDKSDHSFVPSRFTTIHHEVDKKHFKDIREQFNMAENTNGEMLQHMIGTNIISVGYDFKAIQDIYVLGLPDTYHSLLQLFGRTIRAKSHELLPPEKRKVTIHLYINMFNGPLSDVHGVNNVITPERYIIKWQTFNHINNIIRIFEEISVDRDIYDNASPDIPSRGRLEYYAKELFDDQIANVYRVIKRLFLTRTIWEIPDLLSAVKNPPIYTTIDMSKIEENMIMYILSKIIYFPSNKAYLHSMDKFKKSSTSASTLFNFEQFSKYFIKHGMPHVVVYRDPFLMLIPINAVTKNIAQLPIQQRYTTTYTMNFTLTEVSKLIEVKNPTIELFKIYESDIHETVIRIILADKQLLNPLYKFYISLGIIRHRAGSYEYVKNDGGYTMNGEGRTATWTPFVHNRPPYAKIVGYYDRLAFKIIDISLSKLAAANRSDLKKNIAGKNKDALDARQFSRGAACITYPQHQLKEFAKTIGISKLDESTVGICNIIEAALISAQLSKGDKNTHFLFWGPPV